MTADGAGSLVRLDALTRFSDPVAYDNDWGLYSRLRAVNSGEVRTPNLTTLHGRLDLPHLVPLFKRFFSAVRAAADAGLLPIGVDASPFAAVRATATGDPTEARALVDIDDVIASIDEPVVLVGHSLGGYLSLAHAATRPGAAKGVIVLNTGPGFRDPEKREGWRVTTVGEKPYLAN